MLSPSALAILATPSLIPISSTQRACQLLADYDLSLPRKLIPAELDARYLWRPGHATRLLGHMVGSGLLVNLTGLTARDGVMVVKLAGEHTWTPKKLADQWEKMAAADARTDQVQARTQG